MQAYSNPSTVDPKRLSFQEYPFPSATTAFVPVINDEDVDDAIAITSGQIDLEDGDGTLGRYGRSGFEGQNDLDADLDLSANFDFSTAQAFSAPPTLGLDGFHSDFASGEEGSSLVTDPEPWNHLKQTFAISISGPDGISSQGYQVRALSQWSSDQLAPPKSQPPANSSDLHYHRRRRTFAGDQSTRTARAPPELQSTQAATARTPSLVQLRRKELTRHHRRRTESSFSSTSSPTPFPELDIEEFPSQSSYSNPIVTRREGFSSNGRQERLGGEAEILENELDEMSNDWFHTPRPGLQTSSSGYMSPSGNHWQQNHSLSSVGNQFADQLHHSDAITIPRQPESSEHYDSHRPSSFPITAGFVPPKITSNPNPQPGQSKPVQCRRRDTDSVLRPTSLPIRRKVSNKSARASRSVSLSTIREGHHNLLSVSPTAKGKRSGPLSKETKEEAKQKRVEKSVCIRCHMMKSKCEGDIPCEGCCKNLNARLWAHPCMRSYFLSMIEQETCNAIFQRSISHPTLDGLQRLAFSYARTFNIGELLRRLESCRFRHNIRVRPWSGRPYTVDLALCFDLLSRYLESRRLEAYNLNELMDNKVVKVSEWLRCMREYDQNLNVLDQSIDLNDMPSRHSYEHLYLDGTGYARPLDVFNERDVEEIIFAAQLNRIILRALELEAYGSLQRSINELPKMKDDSALKLLNGQLGRLILSLRWRIAWWTSFGHWFEHSEEFSIGFTDRVRLLTHVLYCYFFITKKKLTTRNSSSPDQAQPSDGNFQPPSGDLPNDDTPTGFDSWMQLGQDLLQQARA